MRCFLINCIVPGAVPPAVRGLPLQGNKPTAEKNGPWLLAQNHRSLAVVDEGRQEWLSLLVLGEGGK